MSLETKMYKSFFAIGLYSRKVDRFTSNHQQNSPVFFAHRDRLHVVSVT